MPRFYVNIEGIPEDFLEFLGYDLIKENDEFKLYNHIPTGEECIVKKDNPYLLVEDSNDASLIWDRYGGASRLRAQAPPEP